MDRKSKAKGIREYLDGLYPDPPIPLYHVNSYTLCIAVLLSAHTTDKSVNAATPTLFRLADNPADMVKLGPDRIKELIRNVGLSNAKSRNVWNLSRILLEKHGGELPRDMEALEELPGVGHKTASVVMCQAFHVAAFPVDTHIHRLAERWGLSSGRNVEQTEADLKSLFPESSWTKLHLQLIYYGREYCPARHHDLGRCELCARYAIPSVKAEAAKERPLKAKAASVVAKASAKAKSGAAKASAKAKAGAKAVASSAKAAVIGRAPVSPAPGKKAASGKKAGTKKSR